MKYHVYFIDTRGEPYVKVQMNNRNDAIKMMIKYANRNFTPVLKCEFLASSDDMVLIYTEGFIPSR